MGVWFLIHGVKKSILITDAPGRNHRIFGCYCQKFDKCAICNFHHHDPINNGAWMFQVIVWRRLDDQQVLERMVTTFCDTAHYKYFKMIQRKMSVRSQCRSFKSLRIFSVNWGWYSKELGVLISYPFQYAPWITHMICTMACFVVVRKRMIWWRHDRKRCPHFRPFVRGSIGEQWIPP